MEIDLKCLFADLGDCDESEISCRYFCKPPVTTADQSLLLGCKTTIESLILHYGKINMNPCNIEQFNVCSKHSKIKRPSTFKNCCLCRPFGRVKISKSGLRPINKSYAIGAWQRSKFTLAFGRQMCTQCRHELTKLVNTDLFKQQSDEFFEWLYDTNITHTPSTSSSDSHHVLSQSFNALIIDDEQKLLKKFLQDIRYNQHIPTTTSFMNLQPSSQRRFCRESTHILKRILAIMAPNDNIDDVWQENVDIQRSRSSTDKILDDNLRIVLRSLSEAYNNANHWTVRRQILSIMAKDLSLSTIRMFIPDLTEYRFKIARKHADFEGKGAVIDIRRTPTIRYEDYQLEHFIEFIVSPHICTDLPFGEKSLHLSSGETLLIPLTIRNLAPQRIITQYYNYCKEYYDESFRPLGESTLFHILSECTASIRRSLSGLDSFSAEGSSAFDYLIGIIDELSLIGLPANDANEIKKDLQNSRNYLKTDYKVHISSNSSVADHCSTFALSETDDKCWQTLCGHDHDQKCDRCELIKITLIKVRTFIERYQQNESLRDRFLHRLQHQIQCINDWKTHLLRTVHQDQARVDVLSNLNHESVLIYVDWAMKWLPVKYRESTKDHFAKRGLSWHIAYVIRKAPYSPSSSPSLSSPSNSSSSSSSPPPPLSASSKLAPTSASSKLVPTSAASKLTPTSASSKLVPTSASSKLTPTSSSVSSKPTPSSSVSSKPTPSAIVSASASSKLTPSSSVSSKPTLSATVPSSSSSSKSSNLLIDSEEITNQNDSDDCEFQHKVYCHVFDQCIQNAKTVISILRHIFLCLRQTSPEIKYVHLRSDNAGCYHGSEALLSVEQLFKETGIWIKSINFCDPQSGKGPCDRMAAVIKCTIRRFINEKNNCTNAFEFIKASERTNGVEFYASEIENPLTSKVEWKGVKQINNIEYFQDHTAKSTTLSSKMLVWQAWKIGSGKLYSWCDLEQVVDKISPLKVLLSSNQSTSWITECLENYDKNHMNNSRASHDNSTNNSSDDSSSIDSDNDSILDNETRSNNAPKDNKCYFDCLTDGCTARYRYYANLLRHYAIGRHNIHLEKYTLIDKSKMLFHQSLTTNNLRSTPLLSFTVIPSTTNVNTPPLHQGWALPKAKSHVRFNDKQKKFLQEKFNEGVQSGMKWDPARVSLEMETRMNDGSFMFDSTEWLNPSQIKSFFSRMSVKQRLSQETFSTQISTASTSTTLTSIDNNMITSNGNEDIDDMDDNEEVDDQEIQIYSWRHMVDEARDVLDKSLDLSTETSIQSTNSNSPSNNTPSVKRKSTAVVSKVSKSKLK